MRVGKCLYHCHGGKKGKLIRCYPTVEAAKAAHRAIMASETKGKKKKKRKRRK